MPDRATAITWRDILPSLLVLVLAVLPVGSAEPDPCASTDGPQFRCWLAEQR